MVAKRDDLKHRVVVGIESLPEDALAEVANFVEYQHYKAGQHKAMGSTPYRPVALGGLYAEFDLSEEEIAEARREMWGNFGNRGF